MFGGDHFSPGVADRHIPRYPDAMRDPNCLFCKIVAREIPSALVFEDDHVVAFRDVNPQAPLHVLVVPREHIASLDASDDRHQAVLGALLVAARRIARDEGVSGDGYRTVINTGDDGGQSVQHLHVHVLGGRRLTWPPG
jgi:histidine triad (HIT) family protein